jgi:hypothetical protein
MSNSDADATAAKGRTRGCCDDSCGCGGAFENDDAARCELNSFSTNELGERIAEADDADAGADENGIDEDEDEDEADEKADADEAAW